MRELMSPPIPFPDLDQLNSTIMKEAVRLFALNGYAAVSIRDIAAASNVHPAVVSQRFPSKRNIMERIMQSAEEDILNFYGMLDRLSNEASSFPQIVSNIFMESKEVVNPFAFYAVYCSMIHQFQLDCCRHLYYDIYLVEGHRVMRRQLQIAIQRELVKPFDVAEVAATITNCFVTTISLNVGHINGFFEEFHPQKWYEREIKHILRVTETLEE